MDMHDLTRELKQSHDSKIVMVVADGLGGLPMTPGGLTELETAKTPNLDELATRGVLQMLKFGARIVAPVEVQKLVPATSPTSSHVLHLDCGEARDTTAGAA